MRALHRWTLVFAIGWVATAAAQDKNVYLAQAKVYYQGLEFEKCLARLDQASRLPDNSRDTLAEVELYNGLCSFNLGKRDDAVENFKLALQFNPDVSLPPGTSPRIVDTFEPLAAKARADRPTATAEKPKRSDAPREVTLAPTKTADAPLVTAAAPGGGSKVLPIALGGTSLVSVAVAAVFGSMAKNHEAQANDPATYYADSQALGATAQREALISNIALGVAATAAAGAVITWIMAP